MTNYRPTSLLTIFRKYSRKLCITRAHKQHTEQFGFRKGIPSENDAFRVTDCVLKSINQKNACGKNFMRFGTGF